MVAISLTAFARLTFFLFCIERLSHQENISKCSCSARMTTLRFQGERGCFTRLYI